MNNTVEIAKSFKKFFMFIIMCIVLGGFLSRYAQTVLDEKWALFSRSLAAKKIEVSRPIVLFARSGLPTVGAFIDNLSYVGDSRCFEYRIKAEQLFLPLNLSKIFLGRLEFGTLQVENTHLQIQESPECLEGGQEKKSKVFKDDFEDVIAVSTEKKKPEFFEHFEKWFSTHQPRLSSMPLRHFFLKKIEIEGETLREKHLEAVGRLSVSLEQELVAELTFEKLILGKTTRSVGTQFQAQIHANADTISFSGDWAYYEGHLLAELHYSKNEDVAFSLKSQNLPLSVVNRWFDTPWTFQFLWFNCGLNLKTQVSQWQAAPWIFDSCKMTGPHGEIEVVSQNATSLSQFDDLRVNLKEVQLDRILKGKENLPLSGVIKDYGVVNGDIAVKGPKAEGRLSFKEPSILFSRKNKRLLQVLDLLQLNLRYENSYYTFSIPEIKIRDGQFRGFVEAAYYKKQDKLVGQVRVPQLSFSSEIQKLMLSGEISPLSIDGEIEWFVDSQTGVNGKIQLGLASYKNDFVNVTKGTALVGWTASEPQLALTAEQIHIEKVDSTQWLFASLMDERARQQIHLQQIYINGLLVGKNKLDIKKSTATMANWGRLSLVGLVDWIDGQGQARWQPSHGQPLDWEWSYRAQDSTWIPQSKHMRDWIQLHDEYTAEYPFVR